MCDEKGVADKPRFLGGDTFSFRFSAADATSCGIGGHVGIRQRASYLGGMTTPTTVTIAHSLGRAEARRRIQSRLPDLGRTIPGGVAELHTAWPSEDQMTLDLVAMGQRLSATLDVQDTEVVVTMLLPPLLGFMAGMIAAGVRDQGAKLLLDDHH